MKKSYKPTFLPSESDVKVRDYYKNNRKFIKKIDVILLVFLAIIVVTASIFAFTGSTGEYAEIYYKGENIYTVNLSTNKEFTLDNVDGSPTISVKDGGIAILENDCKSQVCVKTGYISKAGQRIVCAPNRIVIVIRSSKSDNSYDAVTGGVYE